MVGRGAIHEGYWTLVIGQNPCGAGPLVPPVIDSAANL